MHAFPALYATVLKFSSSAPYGYIPSHRIPFLLGEPPRNDDICSQIVSLDTVPVENDAREKESCRAPVTNDLEPREPTPDIAEDAIPAFYSQLSDALGRLVVLLPT